MKTRMSNRDIGADTDTNTGQVYQYTETEHRGGGGGKGHDDNYVVSFHQNFSSVQFNLPSSNLRAVRSSCALNDLIRCSRPPWDPGAVELTSCATLRRANSRPAMDADGLSLSSSSLVRLRLRSRASSRLWRELLMLERDWWFDCYVSANPQRMKI